jgi:myosin heavy subunit
LKWRKVDYTDNKEVINLVETKRNGIFALLDEECIVPKGSDKGFTAKVHTTHSANACLEIPKITKDTKGKKLNKDEGYLINHFAGQVTYNTFGFLDKNNDTIHDDLTKLLYLISTSASAYSN